MKNFIKISLVSLALLLATHANAQLLPVSMGVKGGVNFSNVSTKGNDSKTGFNAGLTLDVNLPLNLAIMSGLELTTKGAKIKGTDLKMNAMYIQLPIHMGYRIKLLPGLRAHFSVGPYFAQGIGGKTTGYEFEVGGTTPLREVKYNTFGDERFKKFDWGLGVGVGVTIIGRVQVRAGYDFGLANIAREGDKVKNRNLYLSAGLLFF